VVQNRANRLLPGALQSSTSLSVRKGETWTLQAPAAREEILQSLSSVSRRLGDGSQLRKHLDRARGGRQRWRKLVEGEPTEKAVGCVYSRAPCWLAGATPYS